MPIILDGTTGITTPGITNTGTFVFQGPIQVPAGTAASPSVTTASGGHTGLYFPSSSSVALSTNGVQRFVVSASGDIGIGTSSPVSRLSYSGTFDAPIVGRKPSLCGMGSYGGGIGFDDTNTAGIYVDNAANNMRFFVGMTGSTSAQDSVKATLNSSGNLGLGVTPSAWGGSVATGNLQLAASALYTFGTSGGGVVTNAFYNSSNQWVYRNSTLAALYQQSSGVHEWYTAPSGTAGNTITFTQAMTLGSNGNLAIGATNTTVAKLYVVGSGNANSIMTSTAAALTGSANAVWIGDDGTDALIGPGNSGSSLSFLSRAGGVYTKAMTLDASGNLGVGTTSPIGKLHINSNSKAPFVAYGFKSGEMRQKQVFNGTSSAARTVPLLTIDNWQSNNSNIFVVIEYMTVSPVSAYGQYGRSYAFNDNGGSSAVGTFTAVESYGSPPAVPTLQWSGLTLQMVTPAAQFAFYTVNVGYIAYDGADVSFVTSYYDPG